MARYRRYTKTIVRAPRKKWNLGHVVGSTDPSSYSVAFVNFSSIVTNSTDNSNPSPTIVKAKRIRCCGCLTVQSQVQLQTTPQPIMWTSYLVYVPQIVYASFPTQITDLTAYVRNMLNDHPEWIMSKKNLNLTWNGGTPSESVSYKWTQSTGKLKRNLKSGDRIIWILLTRPLLSANDNHWQQCSVEFDYATCPA